VDTRALLRLVALAQRELSADDARAELGGRPPGRPGELFAESESGFRIVVVFDEPTEDLAAAQAKLELLVHSFGTVAERLPRPPSSPRAPVESALGEVLEDLRAQAGAVCAAVIDQSSPMIWGTSTSPAGPLDVDTAAEIARVWDRVAQAGLDPEDLCFRPESALPPASRTLDPRLRRELERLAGWARDRSPALRRADILTARALTLVRTRWAEVSSDHRFLLREGRLVVVARSFATTYRVLTVHHDAFSELHAEAALTHALPIVEALVLRLPPAGPATGHGQVVRLPRRPRPARG
jgi:hypothetical protein